MEASIILVTLVVVPTAENGFALRAHVISYMNGKLLKMAAHILMIIIVIFTIPTEPSPSTERDDRAGLVVPSGDVHNNGGYFVDYSYGDLICSPGIIANFFQINIIWVTSVGNTDSWDGINRSYGSPSTEEDLGLHIDAWAISEAGENSVGIVFNSINSYGCKALRAQLDQAMHHWFI